jgi:hypothetical protein
MAEQNVVSLAQERDAFLGALGGDVELSEAFGLARRNFSPEFEAATQYKMGTPEYEAEVKRQQRQRTADSYTKIVEGLTSLFAPKKAEPEAPASTVQIIAAEKKGFRWYHGAGIVVGVLAVGGVVYVLARKS